MPSLETVYQMAIAAKDAGERDVFVSFPATREPWALTFTAYGIRGLVVKRTYRPVTASEVFNGQAGAGGTVSELVVRFAVLDVLLAWKRDYLSRTNTNPSQLYGPRPKRRSINLKIR